MHGGKDVAEETGVWQGGRQASPAASGPPHTLAFAAEGLAALTICSPL